MRTVGVLTGVSHGPRVDVWLRRKLSRLFAYCVLRTENIFDSELIIGTLCVSMYMLHPGGGARSSRHRRAGRRWPVWPICQI